MGPEPVSADNARLDGPDTLMLFGVLMSNNYGLPCTPISHPNLPPEAENLPHKEVGIGAPRAMVVDRDPQTVLTVDGRAEMAATRPLAAAA